MKHLALLLSLFASPALAEVRAVFVGIDHYRYSRANEQVKDAGFNDLAGAVGDVERMKVALATAYGLDLDQPAPGQCASANAISQTLTDSCATKAAILAAWDRAIAQSAADDTLILYFAGHGSRFLDDMQLDQSSGYNSTLLAHDAREPGSTTGADIIDFEVRAVIDKATARGVRVVTIFDSCNSGTANRDGLAVSRTAPPLHISGLPHPGAAATGGNAQGWRVHLAAAGDGQNAQENGSVGIRAGVFTSALTAAIIATPTASFADIAARVIADVVAKTKSGQVPQAEGALRATLAGPEIQVPYFEVVQDRGQLRLAGGALVGITAGSRFALYANTTAATSSINRGAAEGFLLTASIAHLDAGTSLLAPEGPLPANLPGRMVAREIKHSFGTLKLPLAVSDPDAVAIVRQLGFVQIDNRGPFALTANHTGMALRGRSGILLAALPPSNAPDFGLRLALALEKIARVEAWLAVVRPRPGVILCVQNGTDRTMFSPSQCPANPPAGQTLRLNQEVLLGVANSSNAPRQIYVLAVDEKYEVNLLLPPFGGRDDAIAANKELLLSDDVEIKPDATGRLRFIALSSDVQLNAFVLEQTATDVLDQQACLSAVASAFCPGNESSRSGSLPLVSNWSVAVVETIVKP